MDISKVIEAVHFSGYTEEQLLRINKATIEALKDVRGQKARVARRSLFVGARVSWEGFTSNGRGRRRNYHPINGTVVEIKQKFAICTDDATGEPWRCRMSSLNILDD
jgi:hypothetical protein